MYVFIVFYYPRVSDCRFIFSYLGGLHRFGSCKRDLVLPRAMSTGQTVVDMSLT